MSKIKTIICCVLDGFDSLCSDSRKIVWWVTVFVFKWLNNLLVQTEKKKLSLNNHWSENLPKTLKGDWTLQLHQAHMWHSIHPPDGPRTLSWGLPMYMRHVHKAVQRTCRRPMIDVLLIKAQCHTLVCCWHADAPCNQQPLWLSSLKQWTSLNRKKRGGKEECNK